MGYHIVEVIGVTVSPLNERPAQTGLEFRRAPDPAICFIQIGPMRYAVASDALVNAVLATFPVESKNVKDSHRGQFEITAVTSALGHAVRHAFHHLMHYSGGMVPRRLTAPLDLLALVANTDPMTIATTGRALDCDVVVDESVQHVVVDYGTSGFPFSVTVRVIAEPPPG